MKLPWNVSAAGRAAGWIRTSKRCLRRAAPVPLGDGACAMECRADVPARATPWGNTGPTHAVFEYRPGVEPGSLAWKARSSAARTAVRIDRARTGSRTAGDIAAKPRCHAVAEGQPGPLAKRGHAAANTLRALSSAPDLHRHVTRLQLAAYLLRSIGAGSNGGDGANRTRATVSRPRFSKPACYHSSTSPYPRQDSNLHQTAFVARCPSFGPRGHLVSHRGVEPRPRA